MISPYQGSRVLIRKRVSCESYSSAPARREEEGREKINSAKTNDFLDLEVVNTKLNSWRMTIHLEYFPPQQLTSQDVGHGVAFENHSGSTKENVMSKALNSMYNSQIQLLNMSITCLSVEEITTEVVNNMFVTFVIILYQHHSDGTRGCR